MRTTESGSNQSPFANCVCPLMVILEIAKSFVSNPFLTSCFSVMICINPASENSWATS